ncbi:hypothetical protein Syun_000908 [Stephania yunnanensis]|uniref:Uncharacterized protein n=1 Tax=Stephania yunnanensis TaxID=152371 RepID=A0AAP0LDY2_9MAGN
MFGRGSTVQWFLSFDREMLGRGFTVQWFLSFDRDMFGEVVGNGSSRFSYDDSRMSTRVLYLAMIRGKSVSGIYD